MNMCTPFLKFYAHCWSDCHLFTVYSIKSGKWETNYNIHSFQYKPMHLSSCTVHLHSPSNSHGKYVQVLPTCPQAILNITQHPTTTYAVTGGYILSVSSITISRYSSSCEASYMDLSYTGREHNTKSTVAHSTVKVSSHTSSSPHGMTPVRWTRFTLLTQTVGIIDNIFSSAGS